MRRRAGVWVSFCLFGIMMQVAVAGSADLPELEPNQRRDSLQDMLTPDPEDVPFFRAIVDEQDLRARSCQSAGNCQEVYFLRGLASLYADRTVAAAYFRNAVTTKPTSRLARESRFWLWLLEEIDGDGTAALLPGDLSRRLVREIVDRDLVVHELASTLQHASLETLQEEIDTRDVRIDELQGAVAKLTKQVEQLKKEPRIRQTLQKELKASEKKVAELTNQLEALRRIDQELKEKTPPTRPSEKMTPASDLEPKKDAAP